MSWRCSGKPRPRPNLTPNSERDMTSAQDNAKLRCVIKPFAQLSLMELYAALQLRDLVFVVGQKITAEPEVDGQDPECAHALLYDEDKLVGTLRIFEQRTPQVIGRVAVHPDHQGQGLGTLMMKEAQARLGDADAELHAQAHLEDWYSSLGWRRVGEVYEEAQIPHVTMIWGK